ncbi:hypothetical protein K7640_08220 [Micromonospora sp. PLK6-60]|uniref:hypothetical protein n=1 Tax=Micromonospora sp. PLK6-60 TaxID=2873383 RepID=UPI001CA724EF|nr:hypothetical protein [Micromonospora sp. PLK6-60]MBY8871824.1 hypothetical protein [Micromonospora sp. PLK6-60]
MKAWIIQYGVQIFFGLATVTLSIITIRQKVKENRVKLDQLAGGDRKATLFLTRDPLVKALGAMYKDTRPGDTIWGQCVGCDHYTEAVRDAVLKAAGQGVSFRIIVNRYAPTLAEFRSIFDPIASAHLVEGGDNAIRIQGLSDRLVVVSIPEMTAYTGLQIRDPYVIGIFKDWFDRRFQALQSTTAP